MLQNNSYLKVAKVFFNEPTKQHYLKNISRNISLAHTSVKNHLETLKEEELIIETIESRGTRQFPMFKANLNNKQFKEFKTINNLIDLQESKLINFLKDNFMPKSIVLFGSFAKGEDIEDSDIDLFIEAKSKNIDLSVFEKTLNRKIQLHFNEEFKNYSDELKNNIINGIILQGYLKVF